MRNNELVHVRLRPARRRAVSRRRERRPHHHPHRTQHSRSLTPVLSPRTCLPQALQPTEPALGAGQPAQNTPVGTTHCICKVELPSSSLGNSRAPPGGGARDRPRRSRRLAPSTSGPVAVGPGYPVPHQPRQRPILRARGPPGDACDRKNPGSARPGTASEIKECAERWRCRHGAPHGSPTDGRYYKLGNAGLQYEPPAGSGLI